MRKKKTKNTCDENMDEECSDYTMESSDELESGSDSFASDIDESEENMDQQDTKKHKANIAKTYRMNTMVSTILKNFHSTNELCAYLNLQIMQLHPEFIRKNKQGQHSKYQKSQIDNQHNQENLLYCHHQSCFRLCGYAI